MSLPLSLSNRLLRALPALSLAGLLSGCATPGLEPLASPERREVAVAVTASQHLIRFNAARPDRLLSRVALSGLQPGEQVLGIDFRAKNDTLYALGSSGRLYTLDAETGAAMAVAGPLAVPLRGPGIGFDFNPTVDRIRVVGDSGQNLRLHPDTGAVVDAKPDVPGIQIDGTLAYAADDRHTGRKPSVVAAAYSYNKADPTITTNFAIDAATGSLVMQGSREGTLPVVSPNTGRLATVGLLGAGPFSDASFDIHVITDVGFAALTAAGARVSRWVLVDLHTGRARALGLIGGGEAVRGVALEPW
jgi:hypothetical protein